MLGTDNSTDQVVGNFAYYIVPMRAELLTCTDIADQSLVLTGISELIICNYSEL